MLKDKQWFVSIGHRQPQVRVNRCCVIPDMCSQEMAVTFDATLIGQIFCVCCCLSRLFIVCLAAGVRGVLQAISATGYEAKLVKEPKHVSGLSLPVYCRNRWFFCAARFVSQSLFVCSQADAITSKTQAHVMHHYRCASVAIVCFAVLCLIYCVVCCIAFL